MFLKDIIMFSAMKHLDLKLPYFDRCSFIGFDLVFTPLTCDYFLARRLILFIKAIGTVVSIENIQYLI